MHISHTMLSVCSTWTGGNDRALEYFKRALRIYPAMYQAYNRIGIIYGEKGDTMTAISMFKKTIELRPDFLGHTITLGRHIILIMILNRPLPII